MRTYHRMTTFVPAITPASVLRDALALVLPFLTFYGWLLMS